MKLARGLLIGAVCAVAARIAWGESSDDLTSSDTGRAAFSQPFAFVKNEALVKFRSGSAIFRQPWLTARTDENPRFGGLGPIFNRLSCIGCHFSNGRGEASASAEDVMRSSLVRLSVTGKDLHGGPLPELAYGDQLQTTGIPGIAGEGDASIRWTRFEQSLPDGTNIPLRRPELVIRHLNYGPMTAGTMTSVRMSPAVFGLGLLAAVPDEELTALADPEDRNCDGVRGRLNHVWNLETGRIEIGRFGLKANQPTLRQQVAGALNGDMGITSHLLMQQNCTASETDCLKAPANRSPEISDEDFVTLVSYVETIAPPARRTGDVQAARGNALFGQIGCAACHVPVLTTGANPNIPQISKRTIHPYTDVLLHDMGEGLADGRPDFEASGRDWRTAPLWGIGLASSILNQAEYLHDGRARDLNEAILWHGGEAQTARDAYAVLTKADREAVVAFLNSL